MIYIEGKPLYAVKNKPVAPATVFNPVGPAGERLCKHIGEPFVIVGGPDPAFPYPYKVALNRDTVWTVEFPNGDWFNLFAEEIFPGAYPPPPVK